MKVKSMKGFTLAELLIVMGIIVVLAAIAIPTFGQQLETARETADSQAIRAVVENAFNEAFTTYTSEGTITKTTPYPAAEASQKVNFTQTGAGFKYVTPSYSVGSGTVTCGSMKPTTAVKGAEPLAVTCFFEVDGDDGIKLIDVKISNVSIGS